MSRACRGQVMRCGRMAAARSSCSLETLLNEVTDPENVSERWDSIQEFYQLVNSEQDGPQVALRLLAHKIQSPQEREALQALTLLEACMNNCGKRFRAEATKFRFLNELIKVLSPKYLGSWSSAQVKEKITEVLYSWTQWLKDEPKVQEAYHMLKKQGLVKSDPKLPDSVLMPPPSPRQDVSVFDDEDKAKLLSRLLKSGRPEDLETANRLIKSTVREEQEKMEREGRRISTLQEVEKCTSDLRLLLNQHTHHTAEMKDLYERCDRLRPNLFRLASDTLEDDEALAGILKWNDELSHVMNLYREKTQKEEGEMGAEPIHNNDNVNNQEPVSPIRTYHLINFSVAGDSAPCGHTEDGGSLILLDEDSVPAYDSRSPRTEETRSYLDELIQLEDMVRVSGSMEMTCGNGDYSTHNAPVLPAMEEHLTRSEFNQPIITPGFPKPLPPSSLQDIHVPLGSIKPSHLKPITVFDHHGVRVSLHFTKEAPASRPDVAAFVISAVNTSALPVSDFLFLAAVPKTMQVKLQPATGSALPPYSPLLPPAAISQILLLSNPLRKPVRVRFKLTLTLGGETLQQDGEIDQFPEWDSWTDL
ncbi:ADP-ribosylation factor-binding protein GGA3-like [Colossoma macropomum]|uniref:ADP-ribosylation factor-binding protein GGA3-like n=1 Tax=Colossoma macropomum TaxID=42526 RepID=UPI0018653571|nr:ADP-ribosylation factor-binding protein GGA3-like [Colossoma macropomum]